MAKPGLDGHDRGAKIISRTLRDAGFEVIYTGLRRTPEEIVSAAIQEDANLIGLSILSGAHNVLFPKIMTLLAESGVTDVKVIAGGIIPEKDISGLKKNRDFRNIPSRNIKSNYRGLGEEKHSID